MCTQSHESVFQEVRGHGLVFRSHSVTGRGASLCSNSLYHCSKGSFTHEPLHEVAIKLPTMSSRYGRLFIIFYCLVQHVIQGQNVDNMRWMESNVMDSHFRGWKMQQKSTFVVLIVDYRICWCCMDEWQMLKDAGVDTRRSIKCCLNWNIYWRYICRTKESRSSSIK